jgi:hypothetical protein
MQKIEQVATINNNHRHYQELSIPEHIQVVTNDVFERYQFHKKRIMS